jgi:hypothetical protein
MLLLTVVRQLMTDYLCHGQQGKYSMKNSLAIFAALALLASSQLGGCHAEIRDPGPLAKACSQGNGHFECQVQTVIRALKDTFY